MQSIRPGDSLTARSDVMLARGKAGGSHPRRDAENSAGRPLGRDAERLRCGCWAVGPNT
jgi:hypothetical protein